MAYDCDIIIVGAGRVGLFLAAELGMRGMPVKVFDDKSGTCTHPAATSAKKPMIVMNAGTSDLTGKSPYITRVSAAVTQYTVPPGPWAVKNNLKKNRDGRGRFRTRP